MWNHIQVILYFNVFTVIHEMDSCVKRVGHTKSNDRLQVNVSEGMSNVGHLCDY